MSRSDRSSSSDDEIDVDLEKRIQNFVATKSYLLFDHENSNGNGTESNKDLILDQPDEEESTNLFIELPPIETFMNISAKNRKEHLFKLLEIGDIVIASIDEIKQDGIKMNMVCFDNRKRRDLEFIKFDVICPIENIPDKYLTSNGDALSKLKTVYFKNDLLRCVVNDIDHDSFTCKVSLKWNDDSIKRDDCDKTKLGLISSEDLPIYYQNISYFEKEPYLFNKKLKRQRQFNNPAFIDLMIKKLNLTNLSNCSLMKGLENFKIDEKEKASELHKQQNKNLALQSVQKGVSLFREGKPIDAMLSYNKALSIDSDNVEAYVARGALSASDGDFDKAIKDLEKALLLDSTHSNARNYLKEVFLAYATRNEKNENYDDSLIYLKKALEIDPDNDLIISKITDIKIKIEDSYNKNRYGPSLPRQVSSYSSTSEKSQKHLHKSKHKKSKKKSVSSSRSRSTSSSEDLNESSSSNRKISSSSSRSISKDKSGHNSRKNTSHEESKLSKKAYLNKKSDTKSHDESDNEDLEEFYNKLKKNKGSK